MNEVPWLISILEVAKASDESLRLSLITCDGRGKKLKEAALDELLRRARENKDNKSGG